jgi:DNA-binding transcriptional regulator YiaG
MAIRDSRPVRFAPSADYAKLVGVSPLTIYNWEHNKSRPRQGQFTTLVALRGLGKREAQAKLTLLEAKAKSPRKMGRPRKAK